MNIFYVKPKKAPSKGILNTTEKCPHCLIGFVDFMDIGLTLGLQKGVLLGCYACGGVFVSLDACDSERGGKSEMLVLQEMEAAPIPNIFKKEETITTGRALSTEEIDVMFPPLEVFVTKCGVEKSTDKKRKQHEKMCKKCKAMTVEGE